MDLARSIIVLTSESTTCIPNTDIKDFWEFTMIRQNFIRHSSITAIVAALIVSFSSSLLTAADQKTEASRPNILIIFTDDMNDGCCCNEEIARENHCFSSSSERN